VQFKTFSGGAVKALDESEGIIVAAFATIRDSSGRPVVDHDGDSYTDNAFRAGERVAISRAGHAIWQGGEACGKGTITVENGEAVVRAKYFLDTDHGRNAFLTVKHLAADDGPGQPWSYGYTVNDSEPNPHNGGKGLLIRSVTVHECSPVVRAAGPFARTLSAKGYGCSDDPYAHLHPVLAEVVKAAVANLAQMDRQDFERADMERIREWVTKGLPEKLYNDIRDELAVARYLRGL
jgi:hypothetical protein